MTKIKLEDAIKHYNNYVSCAMDDNADFVSFHMFCAMMQFKFVK